MESVTLSVGDLKRIIAEESSQFKAKLGDGVVSGNKSEAGKAYKDAKKRAKDFDGGGEEGYWKGDAEYVKEDFNGTTLDYNPETVDDKFKKRVHAQVKGYSSEAEMNNKEEKVGDFSDNEKIYKAIKKSGQDRHKEEEDLKKTGLQASKMPDGTFKKEEMYESIDGFNMRGMINTLTEHAVATPVAENTTLKTVHFKKTEFVNEDYMRSRIPDEFKVEGCKFKMKDKVSNTYLLEWSCGKAHILEHTNKAGMVESVNRMKQLMEYKSSDTSTSKDLRLSEGEEKLNNTLNRIRDLMK